MRDMYIQKGDGFVMVYSVSSAQSIERVDELFKQISRLNEDKAVGIFVKLIPKSFKQ
jgi:GTPase SAR1 family protein